MAKRILVLEDQDITRRGLATILEQDGHTVLRARNALEAQALCADGDPDVAIVDIELPGLQGNEWALHLKEVSPETRIIFVSGRPGLAGMDRFGPDVHFLHKPIAPEELLGLVESDPAMSPE
jgi:two-component system, OmpR family, alkaline phosphatase synthesis response regulator PhoP